MLKKCFKLGLTFGAGNYVPFVLTYKDEVLGSLNGKWLKNVKRDNYEEF